MKTQREWKKWMKNNEMVLCKMCRKFQAKKYKMHTDEEIDFPNWVTFQICPDCVKNKIPDDKKFMCFKCKKSRKLYKSMENGKYKYCSKCDLGMLQNPFLDRSECSSCGEDAIRIREFRDKLSYDEFFISGQCQDCQDKTFGK
jgi:hypothetical protein